MSDEPDIGDMADIGAALERALGAIEARIAALGAALRARNPAAIADQAAELQRAAALAAQHFTNHKDIPGTRRRVAAAGASVAAQREALARAHAALERAIDVLLPPQPLYGAQGTQRALRGAGISA